MLPIIFTSFLSYKMYTTQILLKNKEFYVMDIMQWATYKMCSKIWKKHMLAPYNLVPWSISPKWRKAWANLYFLRVSHHSITWVAYIPLSFMYSIDFSLNAATPQESWEWNIFEIRGLHLINLKIHSLLTKKRNFKSKLSQLMGPL